MKKLLVLLLVLSFLSSCNKRQTKEISSTQLIPETSNIVLQINDLETFKSDIKNNNFTASFSPLSLKSSLYDLNIIENLDTKNPLYICFEGKKDSIHYTLITKLKDSLFAKEVDSTKFHSKIVDSVFVGSTSKKIINTLSVNEKDIFSSLFKTTNTKKSFSLVVPSQTLNNYSNKLFDTKNERFSSYITLDADVSQNKILLNGITSSNDTLPKLLNVFNQNIPQENSLQNVIPEDFEYAKSITFSDYETFNKNLMHYKNSVLDSISYSEVFETINEIAEITLDDQKIITFHSLDVNATDESLNLDRNEQSTYRDIKIFEYSNDSIFKSSFSPLMKLDSISHYMNVDDFYVFANNSSVLEKVISNYQNGSVLSKSPHFEDTFSNLSDESSILIFTNSNTLKSKLSSIFYTDDLPSLNNYKLSAFQFIKDDNFSHFNGVLLKGKSRVSQNSISEEFSVKLDADVLMAPQFVKNHRTKQQDIVVQDVNNNLYLISNKGKVLWKKALHGNILGKIEQVDLYKNGRLQLAFATPKRVYILDRNGKDVSPFPIKFNDNITQPLSVFDYDKKRNYRFLITQGNEVLMVDKNAKTVKGFKFKKHTNNITSQPKHFRISGKDFIGFTGENKLILLNRRGEHRVKVNENINYSSNEIFLNNNKFTSTSKSGELIQVNIRGSVSKQNLGLEQNHKIDATSKTLVTLSDNNLTIRQNSYELDFGDYTAPKIFYINDKIYVNVTDLQTKKVFLFDSQARLQNHFPVFGNSAIDMINMDKDRNLEFVTVGDSNSIIVYQKN